eukprot:126938-Chlamydomonas_euryale.AAC.1
MSDTALTHGLMEAMYLQTLPSQLSAPLASEAQPPPPPPPCHVMLAAPFDSNRMPVIAHLSRPDDGSGGGGRPPTSWGYMDALATFRRQYNMSFSVLSLRDRHTPLPLFLTAWGGPSVRRGVGGTNEGGWYEGGSAVRRGVG